ncbi:hypothetical protein GCM10022255_112100 [Dactylosporangium darangshiense]|uniref:Uncharacterized protein n=1 Tax=Dactylosporangium darangshiense TaxID=579108 RepID=A0ABP8DVI9_9ACTN
MAARDRPAGGYEQQGKVRAGEQGLRLSRPECADAFGKDVAELGFGLGELTGVEQQEREVAAGEQSVRVTRAKDLHAGGQHLAERRLCLSPATGVPNRRRKPALRCDRVNMISAEMAYPQLVCRPPGVFGESVAALALGDGGDAVRVGGRALEQGLAHHDLGNVMVRRTAALDDVDQVVERLDAVVANWLKQCGGDPSGTCRPGPCGVQRFGT